MKGCDDANTRLQFILYYRHSGRVTIRSLALDVLMLRLKRLKTPLRVGQVAVQPFPPLCSSGLRRRTSCRDHTRLDPYGYIALIGTLTDNV